jgi:hypothetical protein
MMGVIKRERGHVTEHEEAKRAALRPVLLHYAIASHGDHGLRLLHIPLGFDEEALVVFSSWEAAQRYFLSEVCVAYQQPSPPGRARATAAAATTGPTTPGYCSP